MGTWSWRASRGAGLSIPAGFAHGSAGTSRKPLLKQEIVAFWVSAKRSQISSGSSPWNRSWLDLTQLSNCRFSFMGTRSWLWLSEWELGCKCWAGEMGKLHFSSIYSLLKKRLKKPLLKCLYLSSCLYLPASPAGYQRYQRAFLVHLAFQITDNLRSVRSVCSLICLFHFHPDRTFWFLFQASSSAAAAGFLTFS